jgi:hypothetical protein
LSTKLFRCLVVFFLALFLAGSWTISLGRPAEAKAKKITRKVKHKKIIKKPRKKAVHKARKKVKVVSRSKQKKLAPPKVAAKKTSKAVSAVPSQYPMPARTGSITQSYSLEEGIGEDEVDGLISGLKSVGADEVAVDSGANTVTVRAHTSRLTSAGIVKKLKSLGFTAKRAD